MIPVNISSIYSYALIYALHEEEMDYTEIFYPFILQTLSRDRSFSKVEEIQKNIDLRFGFNVPRYALEIILRKAHEKGYVQHEDNRYALTRKGIDFVDSIADIELRQHRRINKFLKNMTEYINNKSPKGHRYQRKDVETNFFKLIKSNIELLLEFIPTSHMTTKTTITAEDYEGLTTIDILIYEYLAYIEENDDEMFEIFKNILLGSIISIALFYDQKELRQSFQPIEIYLDSNFLFSLFEFHPEGLNKAAKELFEILREYPQFKLKVFDFTLSEISRVIQKYPLFVSKYPKKIKVDSIYDILRKKGWKPQQVNLFVSTLERTITKMGIEIERTEIDNLYTYTPDQECISIPPEELETEFMKYKPIIQYPTERAYVESKNHDLAAICLIKKKRGHPVRTLEDSQAIFLTSDLKLSKFDLYAFGHRDYGTIPEVIPDRLFATILWLKNPSLNPNTPIRVIISAYSRNLFIKQAVWEKFYQILKQLVEKGKINNKEISTLFYHDYIETALIEFSEEDIEQIDESFVLKHIEEAKEMMERDIEKQKEQEMQKKMQKKFSELIEQQKPELINEGIKKQKEEILKRIEEISEKKAKKYSAIICGSSAISLLGILCYFVGIRGVIMGLILGGGGIVWEVIKGYPRIKPYLKGWIKNKQLEELNLKE